MAVGEDIEMSRQLEVREANFIASSSNTPTRLEKVNAHDDKAISLGWPKAIGNATADQWAKQTASSSLCPSWTPDAARFGDPVELVDSSGSPIPDISASFTRTWWTTSRQTLVSRRSLFAAFYPADLELDWGASGGIFRRPTVAGGKFAHPTAPATIKWISRVRAGSLATYDRLHLLACSAPPQVLAVPAAPLI